MQKNKVGVSTPVLSRADTEFNTDVLDIEDRTKIDLSRFSDADYVMPGDYLLEIKINQKTLPQQKIQYFPLQGEKLASQVCIPADLISKMALKPAAAEKVTLWHDDECADISAIDGVSVSNRIGGGALVINIPQAWMKYSDPDWTPPEQWDEGIAGLMLDYSLNGQVGKQAQPLVVHDCSLINVSQPVISPEAFEKASP